MIGQRISHYEIVGRLGSGGMGEVYRARDTRLDREVALKLLPADLAGDPERLARFEREAKVLASLNHPNIAVIHDIGEADGTPYLVMELVEGRTLAEEIPKGGLGLDRFFDIAIPLAEAIAAAHERGVVHRDLKPANVMVSEQGRVKVLDFGLAKLRLDSAGEEETRTLADSVTGEGKIVGTVAYMSPEQAEARDLDHRTDVFSLGVILYEMATGGRPFEGDSTLSTLSAILRDTPQPVVELRRDAPRHLGRIITHCLQKDPQRRYQSARDVANELIELRSEVESGVLETPSPPGPGRIAALPWVAGGLAIALLATLWFVLHRPPSVSPSSSTPLLGRLARLTFDPALETDPAWSPDGRFVAYTADTEGNLDILMQPIDGGDPIRAVGHAADDAQAAWSADGSRLAFVSARERGGRLGPAVGLGGATMIMLGQGGDIFVQPAFGGGAVKVVEDGYYPTWSPDGETIAFMSSREGPYEIWLVSPDGSRLRRMPGTRPGDTQPAFSPDGRWIAHARLPAEGFALRVTAVDGTESVQAALEGFIYGPTWSADGSHILVTVGSGASADLWRVPFTAEPLSLGTPTPVISGQGWAVGPAVSPASGRLAFSSVAIDPNIWAVEVATRELRQVTSETTAEDYPDPSPDGSSLLAVSNRSGEMALWTFSLSGEALNLLGPVPAVAFGGRWSPDGKRVAYTRRTTDGVEVVVQTVGEAGAESLAIVGIGVSWSPQGDEIALFHADDSQDDPGSIYVYSLEDRTMRRLTGHDEPALDVFPSFSSDGRHLAFSREYHAGERDLWLYSLDTGEERQLTSGPAEDAHPRFSPVDARLLAFLRDHKNIWILDLESGEERQLTAFEAAHTSIDYPAWSPDGSEIYFSRVEKSGDIFVSRTPSESAQ